MFKTGTYIICGQHGVCRIEDVGPLQLSEASKKRDYYTLSQVYSKGGVIYVPVDSNKIIMRPLLSKIEADTLLHEIADLEEIPVENDRQREEIFKKAIMTCDVKEWIRVIKTILIRRKKRLEQGKKTTAGDERCLHAAQENLYGELAVVLGMEKHEVENHILSIIEKKTGIDIQ